MRDLDKLKSKTGRPKVLLLFFIKIPSFHYITPVTFNSTGGVMEYKNKATNTTDRPKPNKGTGNKCWTPISEDKYDLWNAGRRINPRPVCIEKLAIGKFVFIQAHHSFLTLLHLGRILSQSLSSGIIIFWPQENITCAREQNYTITNSRINDAYFISSLLWQSQFNRKL